MVYTLYNNNILSYNKSQIIMSAHKVYIIIIVANFVIILTATHSELLVITKLEILILVKWMFLGNDHKLNEGNQWFTQLFLSAKYIVVNLSTITSPLPPLAKLSLRSVVLWLIASRHCLWYSSSIVNVAIPLPRASVMRDTAPAAPPADTPSTRLTYTSSGCLP